MNYYNPYAYPPFPQAQSPPMQQNVTYFVNVPSEEVARRWNVDPNTTTRFIDENNGYFYIKSVGASILESPVFERYKISKDSEERPPTDEYLTKSEFESYKVIINDMQEIVKELKGNE